MQKFPAGCVVPLGKKFRTYAGNRGCFRKRLNQEHVSAIILRLTEESATDLRAELSGMSDCIFPVNLFAMAGYRHVSFEECRKYKFLYFRHSCFHQPSDKAGNS
jgi:hypothetical protein